MNNRERILAILDGNPPDMIPWIPRMDIWYTANMARDSLPTKYRGWSLRDIERDLGMGTSGREGKIFDRRLKNVEVHRQAISEFEYVTEYVTPVGTVSTRYRGDALSRQQGILDMQTEFMLKRREDYAVAEYIVENTEYVPTYDAYVEYEREIGGDGYPIVRCGEGPFHEWVRLMVGYEAGYLHLYDYPAEVQHLLAVMTEHDRQHLWPLMIESPARLLLHGYHLSSQMTPPRVFEPYILPYYQELTSLLAAKGKTLALHADNDTSKILSHIERAGYGLVDCYVTHPMVQTTLAQARAAWGTRVIIWGGIPSTLLEDPYTDHDLEDHVNELFDTVAPGDAFILGVADNVMPDARIERLQRIAEIVQQRGTYPVVPRG